MADGETSRKNLNPRDLRKQETSLQWISKGDSGFPGVPLCPWETGLGAGDPWHGWVLLGLYYPIYYFSGISSIFGLWHKLKLRHHLPLKSGGAAAAQMAGTTGSGFLHRSCHLLAWMDSVTCSVSHSIAGCCWKKLPLTNWGNTLGWKVKLLCLWTMLWKWEQEKWKVLFRQ